MVHRGVAGQRRRFLRRSWPRYGSYKGGCGRGCIHSKTRMSVTQYSKLVTALVFTLIALPGRATSQSSDALVYDQLVATFANSDAQVLDTSNFGSVFKHLFTIRSGPGAECSGTMTIEPQSPVPVRSSIVGFLGQPVCTAPAPLMLIRIEVPREPSSGDALERRFRRGLPAPCFEGILPASRSVEMTAWKGTRSVLTVTVDAADPTAVTILLFYTRLEVTEPERARYNAVKDSLYEALPPPCR